MRSILILCMLSAAASADTFTIDATRGHLVPHTTSGGCASPRATAYLTEWVRRLHAIEVAPKARPVVVFEVTKEDGELGERHAMADRGIDTLGEWIYEYDSGASANIMVDVTRFAWADTPNGDKFTGEVKISLVKRYHASACFESWVGPITPVVTP